MSKSAKKKGCAAPSAKAQTSSLSATTTTTSQLPTAIKGFHYLRLHLYDESTSTSASTSSSASTSTSTSTPPVRYLYFRRHQPKAAVVATHPDIDGDIQSILSPFVNVTEVRFTSHDMMIQRSAHVCLDEDGISADQVLELTSRVRHMIQPYHSSSTPMGIQRWLNTYHINHPRLRDAQQQVDRFMTAFDERTAAERKATANAPIIDADGFQLVTSRKPKRKQLHIMTDEQRELAALQQRKRAKKEKTIVNFYRHQEREKKKEELAQLRKKFEEDKAKIANMKANRQFKPY